MEEIKHTRVINEIHEIINSNMKIKWEHILINKIIQDWRDAS